MTREELLTAAREAKAWRKGAAEDGTDWPWLTEHELDNEYHLPPPDALFISLASPDTVLEMQTEIDELRKAQGGDDA